MAEAPTSEQIERGRSVGLGADTLCATIAAGLDPDVLIGMMAAKKVASEPPVMPREPAQLPAALPIGADLPADHDPLAAGILMRHQIEWLEDKSDLKLGEKGRRCGITYAEALDDTLIAASARSAGGDNIFYIGDTKDKGREFIGYVAHFARIVAKEAVAIEEFLFDDQLEDGSSRQISAYRVRFASGYRVEALSSRPENIRGLQGVVVIDEAAFHADVRAVLDAVNALLIWGGRIRVISTHNGVLNPFNELIREAKAGKVPFSLHFIPFAKSVANGLFKRVCLLRGKPWSPEAEAEWEAKIRGAYGARTAQMHQELDAIPADAEGAALTRVAIEAVADPQVPVVRWTLPDAVKMLEPHLRDAVVRDFCATKLAPVLKTLDAERRHDLGSDFARSGDAAGAIVTELGRDLIRRGKLVLEMRNVPFEMQRDVLFFVQERLPRYGHGAFDASGNGAYIAEVSRQKFGERVSEVKLSQEWYRQNGPAYLEAFGNPSSVTLAADEDVIRDHQALQYVAGIVMVPKDMRYKGEDGLTRHGDTAIAGMLAWFASRQGATEYGYEPVRPGGGDDPFDEADDGPLIGGRSTWRQPLGAGLRGRL
jgi:phage FluMu gp28-like protein